MENVIKINCLEVKQPIGVFYVGVIKCQDLLEISRNDIERIRSQEKDGSYFGIQRGLSKTRLEEISQYVSFEDATFPSSIVLSINTLNYNEEKERIDTNVLNYHNNILELRKDSKIAKIIDGQHRVFGLEKYIKEKGIFSQEFNFDLIVTVFIDIDEEYESNIFATINKAQTRVNNSLVYDLYELAKSKSPQRTAHNIVKLLNEENDSPLYRQIKRLGISETGNETIAQATIAENIIKYISTNPSLDRDLLIKGKKLKRAEGKDLNKLFFRNWFIENKDNEIANVIWSYFSATKERWPIAWQDKTKILSKSTGIIALMRFLKDLINYIGLENNISKETFHLYLLKVKLSDDEFTNENFKSGGVGQSDLYKKFKSDIGI